MIDKNNRAGQVYNWLYNHEKNLLLLKFMQENNILPIDVFSMICEMVFSSYKKNTKDELKINKEFCETFESIIVYYYGMIQKDTEE